MQDHRILLSTRDIPQRWYNVAGDLPQPIPPHLNPGTGKPATPQDMSRIFPMALIEQEASLVPWIEIPDAVREKLAIWRPTPLVRAVYLEQRLKTPARIYYKNEAVSPAGSHKPNTAVAQAYYNKQAGIKRLATETGAGQWGSSLAFACDLFGLECKVYMVKVSYHQKPYRRSLMKLWGAEVVASPSNQTNSGRKILAEDPNSSGSLGIAISEAVEDAAMRDDTNYALGSVLNHVCMHQTIIGLETIEQLKIAGEKADLIIGCAGGGSNLAGMILPFVPEILKGRGPKLLAVEPTACPSLTRGKYAYDFGDTVGMAPLAKMYTLGHTFMPSAIHAGGLRYHGMAPVVSLLRSMGMMDAIAYHQREVFEAAVLFARAEGICPAPESSHAIKAAIDQAIQCRETGQAKCIVFNLSGHGHFDLGSYDKYLDGEMEDLEMEDGAIEKGLSHLPVVS